MKIFTTRQNSRDRIGRIAFCETTDAKPASSPRLIISDVVGSTKVLVSKTRSEIGCLDAVLSSIRTVQPSK